MKTPREVLFTKHQNIESKLDAARADALAEVAAGKTNAVPDFNSAMQKAPARSWFADLMRSFRPHFAGLAVVWLIILGIHFATRETSFPVIAKSTAPSPEIIASLKEQKQLYSQLIGTVENSKPADPALHERRPRSEVGQYIRIV